MICFSHEAKTMSSVKWERPFLFYSNIHNIKQTMSVILKTTIHVTY